MTQTKEQKARTVARRGYYNQQDGKCRLEISSMIKTGRANPFTLSKGAEFAKSFLLDEKNAGKVINLSTLGNARIKSIIRAEIEEKKAAAKKGKKAPVARAKFRASEAVSLSDVRKAIESIYVQNHRLFECRACRNNGDFTICEVAYVDNLLTVKEVEAEAVEAKRRDSAEKTEYRKGILTALIHEFGEAQAYPMLALLKSAEESPLNVGASYAEVKDCALAMWNALEEAAREVLLNDESFRAAIA